MKKSNGKKQVIILQIDGLSYPDAKDAMKKGYLPFLKQLTKGEGYELLKYHSGIPATTPYAQAGILYGDNAEIPSFRWWDRKIAKLIEILMVGKPSFGDVANKYFKNGAPLLAKGATIASLYSGGAENSFAVSYLEKGKSYINNDFAKRVLLHAYFNPAHAMRWTWRNFQKTYRIGMEIIKALLQKKYVDWVHFPAYVLDQLFLSYTSVVAIKEALKANYPVIYAGFYSYDNVAHIFGHKTNHSYGMLNEIDNTIQNIFQSLDGKQAYELVILSDHGAAASIPIAKKTGKSFGEYIFHFLPSFEVKEHPGKYLKPKGGSKGQITLTYAGGLAHFYDNSSFTRLDYKQIEEKFPKLLHHIVRIPEIGFVMVKDKRNDMIITPRSRYVVSIPLEKKTRRFLERYDNPEIIARQLIKLNSFKNTGDFVIVGRYTKQLQISFESPVCVHGSFGGHQAHPFILLKKSLGLDTSGITDAKYLYPFLKSLVTY